MVGEVSAGQQYSGLNEKAFWITFDIKTLRAYVVTCLEDERSVLGEE